MNKVDIIRKHIDSDDFYDLNGTEMLSKILAAMNEYAQEQVKLFVITDVSNRRELLIAFYDDLKEQIGTYRIESIETERVVDVFLKSNL